MDMVMYVCIPAGLLALSLAVLVAFKRKGIRHIFHHCMNKFYSPKMEAFQIIYGILKEKLKITVVFTQVASEFPTQFGLQYPEIYMRMSYELASIFSLSFIVSFLPQECVWDARVDRYYPTLLFSTTAPLVVVGIGAIYYITKRFWIRKSMANVLEAQQTVEELYATMMNAFFAFSYLIFVPCSQATLAFFNCTVALDGIPSFLVNDATTQCDTPMHRAWRAYAGAMVFVYPVGIPVIYFTFLRTHLNDIDPIVPATGKRGRMKEDVMNTLAAIDLRNDNSRLKPVAFLFDAYEPQCWWWEVVVCIDRLLMTNVNLILKEEHERVFFNLALALGNVKLLSQFGPYIDGTDDIFAEVGRWNTVVIIIFSIILQCDVVQTKNSGTGLILVFLILSIGLGFCGFCVYAIIPDLKKLPNELRQVSVSLHPNDEEQDEDSLELTSIEYHEEKIEGEGTEVACFSL